MSKKRKKSKKSKGAILVPVDFSATSEEALALAATMAVAAGFAPVVRAWRAIGAVDDDDRLTELGAYAVPRGLDMVWGLGAQ